MTKDSQQIFDILKSAIGAKFDESRIAEYMQPVQLYVSQHGIMFIDSVESIHIAANGASWQSQFEGIAQHDYSQIQNVFIQPGVVINKNNDKRIVCCEYDGNSYFRELSSEEKTFTLVRLGNPETVINTIRSATPNIWNELLAHDQFNILDRITDIDAFTFYKQEHLQHCSIQKNVTKIGGYAFFGCKNISTIDFNCALERIKYHAFNGLESIAHIDLSKTQVCHIGERAFANCTNLKTVILPQRDDIFIDPSAFENCHQLDAIVAQSQQQIEKIPHNEPMSDRSKYAQMKGFASAQKSIYDKLVLSDSHGII